MEIEEKAKIIQDGDFIKVKITDVKDYDLIGEKIN